MTHTYLPMKIYDRQWADALMSGQIFMRPLADFGCWRVLDQKDLGGEALNNQFRGDIGEGIIRNISPDEKDSFFDALPEELGDHLLGKYYIAEEEKHTRVFSMAKLEYDTERKCYRLLDEKMRQFGDTAVIITNPEEFYQRIVRAYITAFPDRYLVEIGEIVYKDIWKDFGEWGVFAKEQKYSWQKEVRLAARLRPDIVVLPNAPKPEPVLLDIGALADIALEVPVEDLLNGKLPPELQAPELLRKIESCQPKSPGLTDTGKLIAGDFGAIYPDQEWISYWTDRLKLKDDWEPVTLLEKAAPQGKELPRLAFFQKQGQGKLFFHYQTIEIHEDETFTSGLLELVLEALEERFRDRYAPLCSWFHFNLGETGKKYEDKLQIGESFSRQQGDNVQTYCLEKLGLKYRNIFGLDSFDSCWRVSCQFNRQHPVSIDIAEGDNGLAGTKRFFTEAEKQAGEVYTQLEKGEDVYEQFHRL